MRVLLDENLPRDLSDVLAGHSVSTVQGLGWAGVKNGELLRRARGVIDALLTMDTSLEHQQDLTTLSFGVVVVGAPSNRMQDLVPLVPEILEALGKVRPGTIEHVGRAKKRSDHLKKT